ncbi:MAG: hypothetical protein ACF8MF_01135 [Phycisphaerales bacterium JB052]
MNNHEQGTSIVLDSETAQPIGIQRQINGEAHIERHSDADGEVPQNSPESRPAHPELKPKALMILMISVLLVVLIAAVAVGIIWGLAPAALVMVFGTGLLFLGNPEVWATTQRVKERNNTKN